MTSFPERNGHSIQNRRKTRPYRTKTGNSIAAPHLHESIIIYACVSSVFFCAELSAGSWVAFYPLTDDLRVPVAEMKRTNVRSVCERTI